MADDVVDPALDLQRCAFVPADAAARTVAKLVARGVGAPSDDQRRNRLLANRVEAGAVNPQPARWPVELAEGGDSCRSAAHGGIAPRIAPRGQPICFVGWITGWTTNETLR